MNVSDVFQFKNKSSFFVIISLNIAGCNELAVRLHVQCSLR